ncbi:hypothetical protein SAMN04487949_1464 [Halogranum gelatinilyticum]|uniref:DUF7967 domain-containing protein n=1 Tax=Halogranum gelatinilyticum TaxID=660521 RepID=A0A1G9SRD8_9EURY|nr:hypothetical protein [Halogranum gelatinilyticum]SDM37960.1 hypothetical protein SAMN04487949_1464 [Halogranum gelatinilyticum]
MTIETAHRPRTQAETRVWMVERTFSADSPHILVTVYATLDGARYLQKERAFNRFGTDPGPVVTAALSVPDDRLTAVTDPDLRERYANEARRMRDRHDPDDAV